MKKAGIALVSVLLAGSLVAFTACGDGKGADDFGKLNGNFKDEKDPDKAAETIEGIDFTKAFGDLTSNDWALGLKTTGKLNVSFDLSVVDMGDDEDDSISGGVVTTAAAPEMQKVQAEMEYECNGLVNATQTSLLAQEELTMSGKEKVSNDEVAMSAKAYVDGSYVYASVEVTGEDPMKVKVSLEDIYGAISGAIGDVGGIGGIGGLSLLEAVPSEGAIGSSNYAQVISMIYQMGGKLSFDQKDGLKVKATFGDEFFVNVLTMASLAGGSEAAAVIAGVSFTKGSSIEVAVAFDKNGLFTEFGINFDLSVNLDAKKLGVVGGTVTVAGGMKIETTSETVTLPVGLATDTSYEEIDLDDFLPGGDIGSNPSNSKHPFGNLGDSVSLEAGTYNLYAVSMEGETEYVSGDDAKVTLIVNKDGTFTFTQPMGSTTYTTSGKWNEGKDGYTFSAEGLVHQVTCFEDGLVMEQNGEIGTVYLLLVK